MAVPCAFVVRLPLLQLNADPASIFSNGRRTTKVL